MDVDVWIFPNVLQTNRALKNRADHWCKLLIGLLRVQFFLANKILRYRKLSKELHHQGSDGAALANFLLFQEFLCLFVVYLTTLFQYLRLCSVERVSL
jgi:hypothetical protein